MALVEDYGSSSGSEDDYESKTVEQIAGVISNKQHENTVPMVQVDRVTISKRKRKDDPLKNTAEKKEKKGRKGPWDAWSYDESDSSSDNTGDKYIAEELETFQDVEKPDDEDIKVKEESHFYGESEKDYQGRGFLHPPADIETDLTKKPMSFKCYLPKKIIHTFPGHSRGVNTLNFLPLSGHLFLSSGNDSLIKIWDFHHQRKCLRDYRGHTRPVKAIDFSSDGTQFLSASFDQSVKLWHTESGKVLSRLKLNSTPNDVKIHPLKANEFIVGCSNSKIYHYDTRIAAKEGRVQVYDHHLSSILYLKFFPDGSRFISSSEDKTVRIWENQINIPVKQISDTAQHSMPYLDIHPSGQYFCAQSMDNTIYTYNMKPKYKRHPKKSFTGQMCAGYGIGIAFSPDGKYICSGDAQSKVLIWDWTTTNLLRTVPLPGNEPVRQVAWNPQETSKLICGGPTGKIYLLD
ncbi:hypothetical protein HG535_0C04120 [Zygotorulaspora mrakii]|uniref:Pre-mRNA-processing factor 17 n=1 Tax=Zygotorulaspora mrakii TaxID=42260 RepID=A0A7H9B0A3_ZYGMR|nr:uncharacterized protein HG535_0C04120 [Zygotorulaspora mrakii]QLG72058.1 hypothetical protein HG535_0C04120 [Zygotorulaspora mrakii]